MARKNPSLHTRTMELLRASKLPIPAIAKGAGIGQHWLAKLRGGKIKHPSVNRVEALYTFLSGQPLNLD